MAEPDRQGNEVSYLAKKDASGQAEPVRLLDSAEEMSIGSFRIKINFPEKFLKQSLSSTNEHRFKLAGVIAAETLKQYPQLTTSYSLDPVPIWQQIRDFVMDRFNEKMNI